MYSSFQDGNFHHYMQQTGIKKGFMRKLVDYKTVEAAGTVVVDPAARYLYQVLPGGKAMRYGMGVAEKASGGRASPKYIPNRNGRMYRRRK